MSCNGLRSSRNLSIGRDTHSQQNFIWTTIQCKRYSVRKETLPLSFINFRDHNIFVTFDSVRYNRLIHRTVHYTVRGTAIKFQIPAARRVELWTWFTVYCQLISNKQIICHYGPNSLFAVAGPSVAPKLLGTASKPRICPTHVNITFPFYS